MKAGDADKSDIGEYTGLRFVYGKTGLKSFTYHHRSPIDNTIKKITWGNYSNKVSWIAQEILDWIQLKISQRLA
ncbi:hypothetical protein ACH8I4_06035 [Acinetobacter sp. ABJ_C3_5]|uniref:hypothetical protein n=1 Tax=Acinetobacter courvalinii TaxID=280147 RepID=UPI0037CBAD2C